MSDETTSAQASGVVAHGLAAFVLSAPEWFRERPAVEAEAARLLTEKLKTPGNLTDAVDTAIAALLALPSPEWLPPQRALDDHHSDDNEAHLFPPPSQASLSQPQQQPLSPFSDSLVLAGSPFAPPTAVVVGGTHSEAPLFAAFCDRYDLPRDATRERALFMCHRRQRPGEGTVFVISVNPAQFYARIAFGIARALELDSTLPTHIPPVADLSEGLILHSQGLLAGIATATPRRSVQCPLRDEVCRWLRGPQCRVHIKTPLGLFDTLYADFSAMLPKRRVTTLLQTGAEAAESSLHTQQATITVPNSAPPLVASSHPDHPHATTHSHTRAHTGSLAKQCLRDVKTATLSLLQALEALDAALSAQG